MRVELVYALPNRQDLIELDIFDGASIRDVIEQSSIAGSVPNLVPEECEVGIWGRVVSPDTTVRDGDRVEIYRPLAIDPMDARRLRAKVSG